MPPLKLPKGAIKPRPAVLAMAPYSPPTGGRADKLRLDFNENTVGCSPQRDRVPARPTSPPPTSPSIPSTPPPSEAIARFFRVSPDQFVFTNGTDEAIQVLINTYVDDGEEVLVLKPSYAMYRFYAEVAGAKIVEVAYPQPSMEFPLQEVLDAITPQTRAILISNPNNPTGTGLGLLAIERILTRAHEGRRHDRRSLLRILRRHRAHRNRTRAAISSSAARSRRSSAWPPCAWAACSRTRRTSRTCTRRSRPTA